MITGVKFNMQQQPKVAAYLAAFKAREGYKLVQIDAAALEPRITTEFSQDPSLLKLYGAGAKPNDVYLFNGAHISLFSDEIRKYYDPDNPTTENIAEAKKHCKKIRGYNKLITLAAGYGASVKRLRSMLVLMGYPVTWKEAEIIHRDYWKLYGGIRKFQIRLEQMWHNNGGWFPNLSGRPICVDRNLLHDSVNRFAQSSGHDVLMKLIYYTEQLRRDRNIPMKPWIPDWHDEHIWEVPVAHVDAVCALYQDALDLVNAELEMGVTITGDPQIADNLAEIKVDPEDYEEYVRSRTHGQF